MLCITTISCSSSDNDPVLSDQYLNANVNGLEFNSDNNVASLNFTREIGPDGRVNLFVKANSADGDVMEFLIENYSGTGIYYIGDNLYNNSWIKYERPSTSEQWMVQPRGALNLNSNFIEVTLNEDNLIEGRISCRELKSAIDDIFGVVDGKFRLTYFP